MPTKVVTGPEMWTISGTVEINVDIQTEPPGLLVMVAAPESLGGDEVNLGATPSLRPLVRQVHVSDAGSRDDAIAELKGQVPTLLTVDIYAPGFNGRIAGVGTEVGCTWERIRRSARSKDIARGTGTTPSGSRVDVVERRTEYELVVAGHCTATTPGRVSVPIDGGGVVVISP